VQSVRLHIDGNGVTWAMAKCRVCGEVHKYPISEALAGGVKCKSCGRPMEIQGAVVEAAQPGDLAR
jgi:RNase P subunit RPR2